MRRFALFCLFILLSSGPVLHAQSTAESSRQSLVITHVTVIDTTGAPPLIDRTVVMNNHRISSIAGAGKATLPTAARVIDASGKFLIPGLWDMHSHFSDRDYLPLYLANGVTGLRIMFGDSTAREIRKQIAVGTLLGPRMVIGSRIIDGPAPFLPGFISVHTPEEARRAVDEEKQAGADFIKVYSFLPRDLYFAIVSESKKVGLPFAGHTPMSVSVEEASDAGQKSIEHLTGIDGSCSSRANDYHLSSQQDLAEMIAAGKSSLAGGSHLAAIGVSLLDTYSPARCAAVGARFKSNGTWVCPTLVIFRTMALAGDPSLSNDANIRYLPRDIRVAWEPQNNYLFKIAGVNPAYTKRQFQHDFVTVSALQRAGVGIIAGTDTPSPFVVPGFSLADELELYVKAGLSPVEAIRTATYNAALFLGRERDFGTIESGKLADMVLLDANPLNDIRNIRKISALVYDGAYYDRAALDAMLGKVEHLANRKSIAEALSQTVSSGGIDAAIKQYRELKSTQPDAYNFDEAELNSLGYELLGNKNFKDAIRVFQLNVEAYPQSGNVYDSLAEAYMDNGDKELAIANYQKSLQLDPANGNAVQMLKKLKSAN
jgi:imidazolonepropionase-like amidohydrolase